MGDLFGCCGGIAELKSLLAFKFDLDRLFDEQCLLDHLYGMYHGIVVTFFSVIFILWVCHLWIIYTGW